MTLALVSSKHVASIYQILIINIRTNTLFSRFFRSILGTIILLLKDSNEEQAHKINKDRSFGCKEKNDTTYDSPKKGEVPVISDGIN